MTNKLFDDYIREKIIDHVAEVPSDMWSRIVEEKKNKKTGIFWWETFCSLGLLVCMALFFGWFGPLENNPKLSKAPMSSSRNNLRIENSRVMPAIADSSAAKTDITVSNLNSRDGLFPNKIEKSKQPQRIDLPASIQPNPTILKTKNGNVDKNSSIGIASNSVTNSGNLTPLLNAGFLPVSPSSRENALKISTNLHSADQLSFITANQKALWQNEAKNLQKSINKSIALSSVDCPSEKRNGNHGLFVELFASPDIAFKKRSYKNSGALTYANRKDSTETNQLSFTVGMRLSKEIGEHMLFKTGLQYSQINERFDYRNENERNTTTVVTIRTITNPDGSTTTIRDTSIVEQIGYRVKTTYNHYRSIDIPILLGYEYVGEGWKANLNGGAILNLSSWQEGAFLDTSYAPVSFAKTKSPIFKSKTGVSLFGSISLIKTIGDRMDLFAEPYIKYSLKDLTASTSTFNERFHTMGMLLGIRLRLNAQQTAK